LAINRFGAVVKISQNTGKPKRVAISLELDWGYNRHLETYAGCQSYADQAGWDCTIHPAADKALLDENGDAAYDGVLARVTPALAKAAKKQNTPLVNVWLNSPVKGLPGVFPDFESSGAMAAEHLLARGFREFGYLGCLRDIDSRLQHRGFRSVAMREGFNCTAHRISRSSIAGKATGWDAFVAGLGEWIDTWTTPIGVLVPHDLFCRYLIDVCRSKGLHVSQDVALVGTNNEAAICASPAPSLSSIDLGYEQIGYNAAAMLDQLMSGQSLPAKQELVAPAELIPRQTTDAFASDDPLVARALRYITERGHERMQVNDVANAVKTTRRTLERRFRKSVGRSIAGEITRLRLERAKRRLADTDEPLRDIAKESGFRVADHFYKVFARVEGMPPSQYRAEHQKPSAKKAD
jgi:LacI family transcriptional regulator